MAGKYVAVACDMYAERGKVLKIMDSDFELGWMIGTYSGLWGEWKGRHKVQVTDIFSVEDILLYDIEFTKGMRLSATMQMALKSAYKTHDR